MFKVGEKIYVPVHGIGTVERVEKKIILGLKRSYYIIKLESDTTQIMLPVDSPSTNRSIRKLFSKKEANSVLDVLKSKPIYMMDARERSKINLKKVKTGDPYLKAEVIRDLSFISTKRTLSRNDKDMLEKMKKILISELSLVLKSSKEESGKIINKMLKRGFSRN